jgi:hypothetical protein
MMIGPVGWCRVALNEPGVEVVVRFAETGTGRIAMAEMILARWPGVTADSLRAVKVGRIESWANGPGRESLLAAIAHRSTLSAEQLAIIDSRERAVADTNARWGTSPEAIAAQEAMLASDEKAGVAEEYAAGLVSRGEGGYVSETPLRSRIRNLTLRVPEGQPKPDSFYREVARLFSEVAVNSPRPAQVLAEANQVPVARVHGWVKEARRRGLLAPGERQSRRQ